MQVKPVLAAAMAVTVLTIAVAAGAAVGSGSGAESGTGIDGPARGADPRVGGSGSNAGATGSRPSGAGDGVVGSRACGEIIEGEGPDGSVGYIACDEPPVEPRPQIVEPTPGMADVRARPFDSATVRSDGQTIAVDFVSGIEPCSVLDHVQVTSGDDTVTITLFEGHDADAGDVACIDIGVFKRVIVTLDSPIGGRVIVDGAAR